MKLTIANPIVQEKSVQSFLCKLTSDIPGTMVSGASSDIMQALHIYFPHAILKDDANVGTNVIKLYVDSS